MKKLMHIAEIDISCNKRISVCLLTGNFLGEKIEFQVLTEDGDVGQHQNEQDESIQLMHRHNNMAMDFE
jgi:hypothetical protein